MKKFKTKVNEISISNRLKEAIPFELKEGEELLTAIFVSAGQNILYSFISKIPKYLILWKIEFMKYILNIKKMDISCHFCQ